jgi:hypothetical protein
METIDTIALWQYDKELTFEQIGFLCSFRKELENRMCDLHNFIVSGFDSTEGFSEKVLFQIIKEQTERFCQGLPEESN